MKRFLFVFLFMAIQVCVFGQWEVKVDDDGIDRSVTATVIANDYDFAVQAALVELEGKVVLGLRTDLHFSSLFNEIKITFKIPNGKKEYTIIGVSIDDSPSLVLIPDSDSFGETGSSLMKGNFLTDFKQASLMKMEVSYDKKYNGYSYKSWKTYIFNMEGSANAYNRVKTQQ